MRRNAEMTVTGLHAARESCCKEALATDCTDFSYFERWCCRSGCHWANPKLMASENSSTPSRPRFHFYKSAMLLLSVMHAGTSLCEKETLSLMQAPVLERNGCGCLRGLLEVRRASERCIRSERIAEFAMNKRIVVTDSPFEFAREFVGLLLRRVL